MNRRAEILLHLERRLSAHPELMVNRLGVTARTIANDVTDLNTALAGAASARLDQGRHPPLGVHGRRLHPPRADGCCGECPVPAPP